MNTLVNSLVNLQKSEYLKSIYQMLNSMVKPTQTKVFLSENSVQLYYTRLNVHIKDDQNIDILDFLTDDDIWPLYAGLANSGLINIQSPRVDRIDVK